MAKSDELRQRLSAGGIPYFANDNISAHVSAADLDAIQSEVQDHVSGILNALLIDQANDHNTKGTAARVAKMFVREVFAGRYMEAPSVTDFPNAKGLDELYTLGPITVRSACSHHLVPISGQCWIGVIPGERVIGISKFNRLAQWILCRPQIQEEAVVQLADHLESLIEPKGLAIVLRATHNCMTWRGVKEHDTSMTTSVMRGTLLTNPAARAEFMALIAGQGY